MHYKDFFSLKLKLLVELPAKGYALLLLFGRLLHAWLR